MFQYTPFTHLTWTTGHSVIQDPEGYSEEIREVMTDHVDKLIIFRRAEIPNLPESEARIKVVGTGFIASVHTRAGGRDHRVVTFGYAPDDIYAWKIWHEVSDAPMLGIEPKRPPAPWCLAAIDLTDPLATMTAAHWVGDYQRCLSFAWQQVRIHSFHP